MRVFQGSRIRVIYVSLKMTNEEEEFMLDKTIRGKSFRKIYNDLDY